MVYPPKLSFENEKQNRARLPGAYISINKTAPPVKRFFQFFYLAQYNLSKSLVFSLKLSLAHFLFLLFSQSFLHPAVRNML